MVAEYMEQNLSDFVRDLVVGTAKRIVAQNGVDKIVQEISERREKISREQRMLLDATARYAAGAIEERDNRNAR